ncbi:MAG: response regulator [Candidatus Eisenbacteria bacterium]|nr:response regulator [Candidatus Eisenbacteria bacterium]
MSQDERQQRIDELERQVRGLRSRLEKLGGEVVRADYKVLHLTQEVRRSREAFGFLTGFQNSISRARSLEELNATALKSIISELWMKRAVVLERSGSGSQLRVVAALGYPADDTPSDLNLPSIRRPEWGHAHTVNGETEPSEWIAEVREALGFPYFLWIPNTRHGEVETVLVAGTLGEDAAQEPRLTGHDLDLFVSIGAILSVGRMNLIARGRLRRQVLYQSLLHRVSEVLLKDFDTPTKHFDDVIARVGSTWSLDRVRLLSRTSDGRMANVTNEWVSDESLSTGDTVHPIDHVPRYRDAMSRGETIRIDDVESLGESESAPLTEAGMRSVLLIPITVQRSIVGWASFEQCAEARRWSPEDVQLLEVIAGLVARAIGREREVEERAQLEAEYHHSKKMEAIGQLAGGIAHDFNNLLTTIQGYAQLLSLKLPEEYRDLPGLKEIVMATERAAGLTRQLLSFSRRDKARTGPVRLNDIISDTMKLIARMLGDGVEIELDLEQSLPLMVGDQQQISQMIMNLAINARDAMPDGGRLTVSTHGLEVVGPLARRFSIPGIDRCQVIEVSDTGVGMDEETRERIFEPFFTTKEEGRGTGLGLSIVFSVVRRHGGFVDVTSERGEGTTFSIYLPMRVPEEEAASETEPKTHVLTGREKILVVEDDASVRTMIREVLEAQGYEVVDVNNGREALESYRENGRDVSLVMTDVVMPEMGGHEMWEKLAEEGLDVPMIVMSGFPQDQDTNELVQGADRFLQKPFGPKEIARAVRLTLDEAVGGTRKQPS